MIPPTKGLVDGQATRGGISIWARRERDPHGRKRGARPLRLAAEAEVRRGGGQGRDGTRKGGGGWAAGPGDGPAVTDRPRADAGELGERATRALPDGRADPVPAACLPRLADEWGLFEPGGIGDQDMHHPRRRPDRGHQQDDRQDSPGPGRHWDISRSTDGGRPDQLRPSRGRLGRSRSIIGAPSGPGNPRSPARPQAAFAGTSGDRR